jgi:hypothetical protein
MLSGKFGEGERHHVVVCTAELAGTLNSAAAAALRKVNASSTATPTSTPNLSLVRR